MVRYARLDRQPWDNWGRLSDGNPLFSRLSLGFSPGTGPLHGICIFNELPSPWPPRKTPFFPPPLRPLLHIPKRRPAYSEITQVSHPRVARTLTEKGNRSFAGEKSIFEISRGKRILSSVSAVFRINRRRRIDRSFSGKKLASSQRTITFVCSIDKQKPTHECMYSINNN